MNRLNYFFSPRQRTHSVARAGRGLLGVLLFTFFSIAPEGYAQPVSGAQERVISGIVTDVKGEPIIGANVVVKGTTTGCITDVEGNYVLTVPGEALLQFSYIGYLSQDVPTENRTVIHVQLQEDLQALEEVVVVGYGVQKKATLSGSISSVRGEELLKAPAVNASQMLTGLLPGLTTVQRSGEPGKDDVTIRIRGSNTLGNNDPLVVVDGVPGRSLSRIDPHSIESITILKDASAAIYGSEAANGVILITTQRGKGGKPVVAVNLNQGFGQPARVPQMANGSEYATLVNELDLYEGRTPRYSEEEIRRFTSGSDPWRYPNTDWFGAVMKPWSAQNNLHAQISGGSGERGELRYHIAAGTKYQDAFYRRSVSNYHQYDLRSNLDLKLSEYVKLALDLYGRNERTQLPTRGYAMILRSTLAASPNLHAVWPNGAPGPDILEGSNPATVATEAAGYDREKVYTLNTAARLNLLCPWIEGLSFSGSVSYDKSLQNRTRWEIPWEVNTWDGQTVDDRGVPVLHSDRVPFVDPRLTRSMYDKQTVLLNGILHYEKRWGDHAAGVMAGMETIEGKGNDFDAFRRYYVSTALPELFAGGGQDKDNGGKAYENARMNYFGRLNYNFKEKWLFEFVWRYDGSYIFPRKTRFGFFPGASVGWRVSQEDFWKEHVAPIEELKLRLSYGQTGNDRIDEWQYQSSYGYNADNYVYNFGLSEANKLLYEARIPNPTITWEKANQLNAGFETHLLQSRLFFEFDYFDYRRSNILWKRNASVPASGGLTLPRENIGKVTNRGFDFLIRYREKIRDLEYTVSLNGGYARNQITFWDEAPGRAAWQVSTGRPIPSDPENADDDLYYDAIGVFRDEAAVAAYPHWENARPGDLIFRDVNEDGKIDGLDRIRIDKNNLPRFTAGLNLGLTYRNVDLSVLFQGAAGAVRFVSTESGYIGNYLKDFYDHRWTAAHPDATGPRAYNRDAEYWRNNRNTYFLKNTDYVRLKTLEAGYTLPSAFVRKLGMERIRVYVGGYNLFTFSPHLKDFDPESDHNDVGGENHAYPVQRVINGGISFTFKEMKL